ncbi:MAG: hypothetical protein HY794_05145 [Desulfarculus sp.]|nr:hypothetical protein [Desulfarculus sp.]
MKRLMCLLTLACLLLTTLSAAAAGVPTSSPFDYNVGVTYDSWMQSWIAYSRADTVKFVAQDLDKITGHFKMIHTYHDAAVGTSELLVDPGTLGVLTYAKDHPDKGLQVFLGTNEDAATASKLGNADYAKRWVQTILLDPMGGSASKVLSTVKAIGIGNEIDAQGVFNVHDFNAALRNLTEAMREAGLGAIPLTTTIANISHNAQAKAFVDTLGSNWQGAWGAKFVFANNFPWMQSKGVDALKSWYDGAQSEYSSWNLFIGETGYPYQSDPSRGFDHDQKFPSVSGGTGEYTYATDMFNWLGEQYSTSNHRTIPTFMFSGFDEPRKQPSVPGCSENHYGLLTASGAPMHDTAGHTLVIPDWVGQRR